jgi:hypothetical protein
VRCYGKFEMRHINGYLQYERSWSPHKMRQPVQTCNSGYVCSPQHAFRRSTVVRNTCPLSSLTTKISLSPCNVQLLSMTTHHHLSQVQTLLISRGCFAAIADYSMTWSSFFINRTRRMPIKPDCGMGALTIMHFRNSRKASAAPRVGICFPHQILVGYPMGQRKGGRYTMIY